LEINALIKLQVILIAKHQIEWQKIVKIAVAKYGATDKAQGYINKQLKQFATSMVDSGFKLGLKWLD